MPGRYKGAPSELLALGAYVKLERAASALAGALAPHLDAAGLSESQFGVLEALLHLGPLHQCDLAARILKSSGNMTLVVGNLEKRGLVRRERSAVDRRFNRVHLTAEGERLVRAVFPPHAARITGLMGALTAAEQRALARLCRKLGRATTEARAAA
jgi:MarR family transcriptional regulator, 2-MHQ and catechol-resistance regulon repressor